MGDYMNVIIKKIDINNKEAIDFMIKESLKLFIETSSHVRKLVEKDNSSFLEKIFYDEFMNTLKEDSIIYCAYIDNKPVGIIQLENNNYLSDLYVKEEYRNNKIGSSLLSKLIEECNNLDVINVDAKVEAISLYEKFSFQQTGKLNSRSIPMQFERSRYGK